jgi:hypothetical protein
MNRPYYALAALMAVLSGSAAALSPVHCQDATANAAAASRSLCGSTPHNVLIAARLLAHFEAGSEAGHDEQGCEDSTTYGYDDSCGYDPCRGEIYDAEVPAAEVAAEPSTSNPRDEGTFAEECETWPSDERIDQGYLEFERCTEPVDFAELDCIRANQEWLEQQAVKQDKPAEEPADESTFFTEDTGEPLADESAFFAEDWKTAVVETPDWICDYLHGCPTTHEDQYAEAELQAARDAEQSANAEYGPALLESPSPDLASYGEEYQSLYDLDAILSGSDGKEAEYSRPNNGPIVWTLGRFIKNLHQLFDEILPVVEDEADGWIDSADDAWQQFEEISTELIESAPQDRAADELDAPWFSHHQQIVELPAETVDSREVLENLAGSLRWAGQALLIAADGLEAEAERVLSARHEPGFSR